MPGLNTSEIRELAVQELHEEIAQVSEELFRLRFRAAYEELENPSLLRLLRRDLARLKTIRHERELVDGEESDD